MTENKTRQILRMEYNGYIYRVIKTTKDNYNPFWVYVSWYNLGWKKRRIGQYADVSSCLSYLAEIIRKGYYWDGYTHETRH